MNSWAVWRAEPFSGGRSRSVGGAPQAVPPTGNPVSLEHGHCKGLCSAAGWKAPPGRASLSLGKHHTLPEIKPVLRSQPVDHPWKAKGLPTPWFHTQQDIGKTTLFFPLIIPRSGLVPVQGTEPQGDGGLTGSTTLKMLAAFPSRTQLDYHPQDLVYFIAAHRNAVGGHKGIQSSY